MSTRFFGVNQPSWVMSQVGERRRLWGGFFEIAVMAYRWRKWGPLSENELFVLWSEDHYSALTLC